MVAGKAAMNTVDWESLTAMMGWTDHPQLGWVETLHGLGGKFVAGNAHVGVEFPNGGTLIPVSKSCAAALVGGTAAWSAIPPKVRAYVRSRIEDMMLSTVESKFSKTKEGKVEAMASVEKGSGLLADASAMYEPVKGTSSKYFVVGVSPGLKAAARLSGSKLSFRVEGSELPMRKGSLAALGFSVYDKYASIHLGTPTPLEAAKALGALLVGIGVDWESKTPLLMKLRTLCEEG